MVGHLRGGLWLGDEDCPACWLVLLGLGQAAEQRVVEQLGSIVDCRLVDLSVLVDVVVV